MKKNTTLTLLLLLIIMLLVILGFKMYEDYNSDDVTKSIYSFEAYPLYIDNYIFINSEINNNKMYLLYENNNDYLPNPTNIHPSNEGYKAIYLEIMKQLKK